MVKLRAEILHKLSPLGEAFFFRDCAFDMCADMIHTAIVQVLDTKNEFDRVREVAHRCIRLIPGPLRPTTPRRDGQWIRGARTERRPKPSCGLPAHFPLPSPLPSQAVAGPAASSSSQDDAALSFYAKKPHIYMVKETIVQTGNPVLRKHAKPVLKKEIHSKALRSLMSRMKKVLAAEKYGVAIAAPQLGESLRMFIVAGRAFQKPDSASESEPAPKSVSKRSSGLAEDGPRTFAKQSPANDMIFINPELIRVSKKKSEMPEGCLSVRGMYGSVLRHDKATVRAIDEQGKPFIYHGSGLVAQIFQHEIDHLGGILYTDKATNTTKDTRI